MLASSSPLCELGRWAWGRSIYGDKNGAALVPVQNDVIYWIGIVTHGDVESCNVNIRSTVCLSCKWQESRKRCYYYFTTRVHGDLRRDTRLEKAKTQQVYHSLLD